MVKLINIIYNNVKLYKTIKKIYETFGLFKLIIILNKENNMYLRII